MTKHEAIEVLEEVKMLDDSMFAYSQVYNDALDMAIEALKAQEPTKFQIKTTISNVDIPKDVDEEQFMAVLSQQYAALAKLYGEELPTYSPS